MITLLKKLDDLFNIFIRKIHSLIGVTEEAWKCFRCNLTFRDENHAKMHNEISKHSVSKVKVLAA